KFSVCEGSLSPILQPELLRDLAAERCRIAESVGRCANLPAIASSPRSGELSERRTPATALPNRNVLRSLVCRSMFKVQRSMFDVRAQALAARPRMLPLDECLEHQSHDCEQREQ